MKRIHLFILACGVLFCSCADDLLKSYEVGRPDNLAEYAYLTDYSPLKEYLPESPNPNIKLGAAVSADDYVKKQLTYALVNSNFTEVVAGNEMKMASCVGEDGSMSFGNVTDFVELAEAAGVSVYGHTLAWHAQQPVKYLNALIADRPDPEYSAEPVEVEVKAPRRCIRVNSDDMVEAAWDTQFWLYFPNDPIPAGASYEFSCDVMADKAATAGTQTHKEPGGYIHWSGVGTVSFTEDEWSTFKSSGTFMNESTDGFSIAFNLNDFAGANIYYFDNLSLKINGKEVLVNGDCEGDDTSSFRTKESRGATVPSTIVDETVIHKMEQPAATKEVDVPRNCILVESSDMVEAAWDTQFWLYFPNDPIPAGASYEFSCDVMAEKKASAGTQTHKDPGGYIHWSGVGTVNFETEWTTFTSSGTFMNESTDGYSIAFNLNDFAGANKYYFDNISLKINGKEVIENGDCEDPSNTNSFRTKESRGATVPSRIVDHYTQIVSMEPTIPLTPEEKLDVLTTAMRTWIEGMMTEGTKGKVHAWDVVNEAISGGNPDSEGVYALQHANADNPDDKNNFYWQDGMGDLEYVRTAVAAAREFGPSDIKLFVNDYNLESDWDNNGKCKSLIAWVKRWEADGKTKIDGIGTQMHVSYYLNPDVQASKEKAIEEMFKLLAASGKLVRISELDMGLVGTDNKSIETANVTEEQHHKMAEFYKWIIKKYFEIIPANQQWGICQWCVTDSPANSGWRANQPVGLWDLNYNRKHTYAGFADGLKK